MCRACKSRTALSDECDLCDASGLHSHTAAEVVMLAAHRGRSRDDKRGDFKPWKIRGTEIINTENGYCVDTQRGTAVEWLEHVAMKTWCHESDRVLAGLVRALMSFGLIAGARVGLTAKRSEH